MSDMPMTTTTTTTTPTSPPLSRFGPTRSSIQKTRGPDNPFMSAEDEDDDDNKNKTNDNDRNALGRTASLHSQSTVAYAPGITHRSLSSASSHPFAPMHSPVLASSGPSHPYAMYPQDSFLARTASVSTTSTIRAPQRASLPQQGPAHPYAMYPQNVVADVDDAEEHDAANPHPQDHIPIGFPGRAQAFQRQQGPEGEEQDIVGADGHAEQLPPYSEYPENGVPKHIVIVTPISDTAPLTATPSHLPVAQGGPQSMTDASARADAQSFTSMEQMESNQTRGSTPKRWKNKSWKEKRKTKFCGIPFWWIMLSGCVLAFIAVVLGGAIGGFLSSQKKSGKSKKSVPHILSPRLCIALTNDLDHIKCCPARPRCTMLRLFLHHRRVRPRPRAHMLFLWGLPRPLRPLVSPTKATLQHGIATCPMPLPSLFRYYINLTTRVKVPCCSTQRQTMNLRTSATEPCRPSHSSHSSGPLKTTMIRVVVPPFTFNPFTTSWSLFLKPRFPVLAVLAQDQTPKEAPLLWILLGIPYTRLLLEKSRGFVSGTALSWRDSSTPITPRLPSAAATHLRQPPTQLPLGGLSHPILLLHS